MKWMRLLACSGETRARATFSDMVKHTVLVQVTGATPFRAGVEVDTALSAIAC